MSTSQLSVERFERAELSAFDRKVSGFRAAPGPVLTAKAELAVLARVLHREGYNDHTLGHITVRQPDETLFTLPFQFGWDEVRASDIIRIDLEGRVVEGDWDVNPAITVHLELHKTRTNAGVVIHNHPEYATIWAARHRVPPAYDQVGAFMRDEDICLYDEYLGTVAGRDVARRNVEALGGRDYALLANHGVLVVGRDARDAYSKAMSLEWRCRRAWQVEVLGDGGNPLQADGQDALRANMARLPGGVTPFMWEWAVRREVRADPDVLS
jgi:ribulose-5-phosphate 4-epimerase/fuculose-1-phosphate aldolase